MRNYRIGLRIAMLACATLLVIGIPPLVSAARADLPPRPSPPTGSDGSEPSTGASIVLRATFGPGWPWGRVHWQELWTVVEWQGIEGTWHPVEGWQGTLDRITVEENGDVVGEKAWWACKPNLGKGPFRWLVYEGRAGRLIAASDPFHLPELVNRRDVVEISLTY